MQLVKFTKTRYHDDFAYYANDDVIGRSLELYGEYGETELRLLKWLTNSDYVFYDVGANIGVYTQAMASSCREVHAFEPNPLNFALLDSNTHGLKNVHLYKYACGNSAQDIAIQAFDPGQAGNFGNLHITDHGITVPQIRLDNFQGAPADVIKIDVEGRELDVILGAENMIRERQPLITYEANAGPDFVKIFDLLRGIGYRLFWLQNMNYRADNFRGNENNIWSNTCIYSVIAWPPTWPMVLQGTEISNPVTDEFIPLLQPS